MNPEQAPTVAVPPMDRSSLEEAGHVIRTLLYFDIFQHPLRRDEIERFGHLGGTRLDRVLADLVATGIIEQARGHYALARAEALVDRREELEARAKSRIGRAQRMSRFIGAFPFVRGVMLSGSISKGVMARDSDIDYFVITAPGRLWVARTLLILYKKIFLLNSRRDFCVNYFVDTDHLAIEDRNLYTATEITTLVPTYGRDTCASFFRSNAWADERFPNTGEREIPITDPADRRVKRSLERLLQGRTGEVLDDLCMRLTFQWWKRRFGGMDARSFELAFRTRKYVSKHHPQSFQQRVLDALDVRMRAFTDRHGTVFQ